MARETLVYGGGKVPVVRMACEIAVVRHDQGLRGLLVVKDPGRAAGTDDGLGRSGIQTFEAKKNMARRLPHGFKRVCEALDRRVPFDIGDLLKRQYNSHELRAALAKVTAVPARSTKSLLYCTEASNDGEAPAKSTTSTS